MSKIDDSEQSNQNLQEDFEEQKELVSFQLQFLNRQESFIKDKIHTLMAQKRKFLELKKQLEEEQVCRFGSAGSEKWPLLQDRY